MCGICGSTGHPDSAAIAAMKATMHHRGPDDDGTYTDPEAGVALGAQRLSIIDVAGGHQPLANEDGTVWAVLNGEIYNHPALQERLHERGHRLSTATDTEVLVHLYEDYGEALVHALEGMFAFAIWDAAERRLLLARDRFGEKPLYYHERDGRLAFASELTALLAGIDEEPELDPAAVDAYFVHGYVPGEQSIVRGVRRLPPASVMSWSPSSGCEEPRPYWSPPTAQPATPGRMSALVDEAGDLMRRSIRSRLVADVPVGVLLSGGVDSTLIAALAAEASPRPIKTFTVGYDVGETSEFVPARAAARDLGAEHRELVLTEGAVAARVPDLLASLDEPLADQALVAMHALAEFAREDVKVVVGGEGADELFGGYPRYRWLARTDRLARSVPSPIAEAAGAAVRGVVDEDRGQRVTSLLERRSLAERDLDWVTARRRHLRAPLYGDRLSAAFQPGELGASSNRRGAVAATLMLRDQTQWLPDDVLAKADRAAMLVSLEVRTPYLHRELAEFAASVPADVHVGGRGKQLLRRLLERVSPAAAARRKVAFEVPAAEWLRRPLAGAMGEQLDSGALYRESWFDQNEVRRVFDDHMSGHRDGSQTLWPLLALGAWLDRLRASNDR